jgi:ABC-type uncharacterized transport system permease subunit
MIHFENINFDSKTQRNGLNNNKQICLTGFTVVLVALGLHTCYAMVFFESAGAPVWSHPGIFKTCLRHHVFQNDFRLLCIAIRLDSV